MNNTDITNDNSHRPMIHIILGPTASGKERTALEYAKLISGEIVSVDSMKIYKHLDIGTAKATAAMREEVPHHLIDFIEPTESFSVAEFVKHADDAIQDIAGRGKVPVLSGGTALYYKGLLEGIFDAPPSDPSLRQQLKDEAEHDGHGHNLHARLQQADPRAAEKIHPNDLRRLVRALEIVILTGKPLSQQQQQWAGFQENIADNGLKPIRYTCKMMGLQWPREDLYARIETRVDRMISEGLEQEARMVYEQRNFYNRTPLQAVGYKEFFPYFYGSCARNEAVNVLKKNTRHLAKSQMTWFRKFPSSWLQMGEKEKPQQTALRMLEDKLNSKTVN